MGGRASSPANGGGQHWARRGCRRYDQIDRAVEQFARADDPDQERQHEEVGLDAAEDGLGEPAQLKALQFGLADPEAAPGSLLKYLDDRKISA